MYRVPRYIPVYSLPGSHRASLGPIEPPWVPEAVRLEVPEAVRLEVPEAVREAERRSRRGNNGEKGDPEEATTVRKDPSLSPVSAKSVKTVINVVGFRQ